MTNGEPNDDSNDKKSHRERHSGRKAQKKKEKSSSNRLEDLTDKQRNPKAFAFNSAVRAERRFRRKQDLDTKKQHVPLVDRTPIEPPPILVAVVGPPKVGKSTVINNLIKLFTRSPLVEIKGPVTIVTGKKRRMTFIECNNDINSMIDLAKVADLVLLLCDASFGFEMEIFEFLNICQVHGMPKIMGVLTHLDMIKNAKTLKTTKKVLKHRFWTEVYQGAKLFYLSGIVHNEYLRNEITNLGRFISVMKFRPLTWRTNHGYLLADRYEDLTNQEQIRKNPRCDRDISLYGYIRGVPIKNNTFIHIAGLGDVKIRDISFLPDPCPLPDQIKKRALIEKEKLIYAPFSGVGGIVYDKDAVYVDLGGSHSHNRRNEDESDNIVTNLIDSERPIDVKMAHSKIQIFSGGRELTGQDFEEPDEESDDETLQPLYEKQDGEKTDELEGELKELRGKFGRFQEERIEDSGRTRRRVIFETGDEEFAGTLEEESDDEDGEQRQEEDGDISKITEEDDEDREDEEDVPEDEESSEEETVVIDSPRHRQRSASKSTEEEIEDEESSDEEEVVMLSPPGRSQKNRSTEDRNDGVSSNDTPVKGRKSKGEDRLSVLKTRNEERLVHDEDSEDEQVERGSPLVKGKRRSGEAAKEKKTEEVHSKISAILKKFDRQEKQKKGEEMLADSGNEASDQSEEEASEDEDVPSKVSSVLKKVDQRQRNEDILMDADNEETEESEDEDDEEESANEEAEDSSAGRMKKKKNDTADVERSETEHIRSKVKKVGHKQKQRDEEMLMDVDNEDMEESEDDDEEEESASEEDEGSLVDKIKKTKNDRGAMEKIGEEASKEKKKEDVHSKVSTILRNLDNKDKQKGDVDDDLEDSEEESENEDLDEDDGVRWKDNLAEKAKSAFLERQSSTQNLMKLVYGVFDVKNQSTEEPEAPPNDDEDEEIGGLFKKLSSRQQKLKLDKDSMDLTESSLILPWNAPTKDWLQPQNRSTIANCFVTGRWKDSEDASELLRLDDAGDVSDAGSEVSGDFEDLETGEKHEKRKREEDKEPDREALAEKKRKLKEKFDEEYDNTEKTSYYDDLKQSAEKQAQLNKTVFENMSDDVRVQVEGFRPGMYVRIELREVPSEFVEHFDPTYPIVVGGLNMGEENVGFVNVKIKKHRWYGKILKNRDPLIISLGWRRFQTIPMYSKLEDDMKFRYLKYTPEHLACNAHFWGPITPQGSGFLALQSVESNPEILKKQGFRIAATGVVQELDKSTQIMKKLKLVGYPLKIYKKTAFIKGMFNSALEVARFEGARIKTVSGIRGQIKKAVSKPEGCFRATFEDKILLSDIVFCRTWYKVDVPQFYNPVTTLLLPPEQKNSWKGVRTTGEIKRDRGVRNVANQDSLYKPIQRDPKPFKPLVVPGKLQKALPYRDKPKHGVKAGDRKNRIDRVAVIKEPYEQKVSTLMKMVKTNYEHKQERLKAEMKQRMEKHRAMVEAQDGLKEKKLKQKKKEVFRLRSKAQKSKP